MLVTTTILLVSILQTTSSFIFPDDLEKLRRMKNITDMKIFNLAESELTNMTDMELSTIPDLERSHITDLEELTNEIHDSSSKGPLCEEGLNWCSHPLIQYPTRSISKALNWQGKSIKNMFTSDLSPLIADKIRSDIGIRSRNNLPFTPLPPVFNDEPPLDDNVCTSKSSHIRPRAAKNKEGKWMFLVNGLEDDDRGTEFVQLVQVSTCLGAGHSCGEGQVFRGQATECRQQYSDHKLVALEGEGRELVVDTFRFPSCCTCHLHTSLES